jgi:bacillopeptidase F
MKKGGFLLKHMKRFSRTISIVLCMLLLISAALPYSVFAKTQSPLKDLSEMKQQVENKISKKVDDQYKRDKFVTFLVKFKQQADVNQAAANAVKKANALKATPYQAELQKKSAVVSALRNTATESQGGVKQFLDKQKQAGTVKEIKSFYIVNSMAITATRKVMEKVASFGEVEKVAANEKVQLIQPVPKTITKAQKTADPSPIEWNIDRVQAPKAWNMGINGTGVVVASIDTGVQGDHPALAEKYRGYNPADPSHPDNTFNWFDAVAGKSAPYDDLGHGTHTVGTMVGSEPNGANQIGVAPRAKWIAVKAFSPNGADNSTLLTAGEWILAPKDAQGNPHPEKAPDVVNNSWGGEAGELDEWFRPMVQAWKAADIFPEFSAGNEGSVGLSGSIAVPANYPESFATAATDSDNHLASFSSRGPSPYGAMKPDIAAPGVNIRSSVSGGKYENEDGTSMAGPHVAAVAALLKQANPSLTVDEMMKILTDTAQPFTDDEYPTAPNNGYGHGLVNAYRAVLAAHSGVGEVKGQVQVSGTDTERPTYTHTAVIESFIGAPMPITIQAQDNVRMSKAELSYRQSGSTDWKILTSNQISGNYRGGLYQATIPYTDVKEPGMEYRWVMTDFVGNSTETAIYKVTLKSPVTVGYKQDFESTPMGWYSFGENNSWIWDTGEENPYAIPSKAYFTSRKNANFGKAENSSLVMPPVHIPDGTTYLHFKQFYDIDAINLGESASVVVSTDMQKWTPVATYSGGNFMDWVDGEADLSAYAGKDIFVAFHYTTPERTFLGWYIDNVSLDASPLAPAAQTKLIKQAIPSNKPESITLTNISAPVASSTAAPTGSYTLPGDARVTVLETGRSATTSTDDGSFSLKDDAGTFTLRAEAYGYRSADKTINITKDGAATADFTLEQLAKGTVSGQIINKATGQPVADARISLTEDAAIHPVQTGAEGKFTIRAYEGTYILHVSGENYKDTNVTITIKGNQNIEQNIQLCPFIGYPGEVGYDDGTGEDLGFWFQKGNGLAVKMSLPEGKQTAKLKGGLFKFWNGIGNGQKIQVVVYDATGPHGYPGKMIGGPIDTTVQADGNWMMVDLSSLQLTIKDDFYIGYIQTTDYPNTPGISVDQDSQFLGHSYTLFNGVWGKATYKTGNMMIHAIVDYEAESPTITSPVDGMFTNQATVDVEGKASANTIVHIQNKGIDNATGTAKEDGTFSIPVTLQEGENALTATVVAANGETAPSESVKVILDQTKPKLTITSPADGSKTNQNNTTITGKVEDERIQSVKVNGTSADIQADGAFSAQIFLKEGVNTVAVVAVDKAGNEETKSIQILSQWTKPVIQNLKPAQDLYVKTGQIVKVEFDSKPGLKAMFEIKIPDGYNNLNNYSKFVQPFSQFGVTGTNSTLQFPLLETTPGHYVGFWRVTSNLKDVRGAAIEVSVRDEYSNETKQQAAGKLYINTKK